MNWSRFFTLICLVSLAGSWHCLPVCNADEIVIDDQHDSGTSLGDFSCKACLQPISHTLDIVNKANSGELSAGELWKFFHEQGISSLDHLTLCVDVDGLAKGDCFGLSSVRLCIEDPANSSENLTIASSGNHSLVLQPNQISSFKPEAKLEFPLGYDFMQRFSADSTAKVKLDVLSQQGDNANAKISIEGGGNVFTRRNLELLVGFSLFWLVVFYLLNRLTKPLVDANEGVSGGGEMKSAGASVNTSKASNRMLSA